LSAAAEEERNEEYGELGTAGWSSAWVGSAEAEDGSENTVPFAAAAMAEEEEAGDPNEPCWLYAGSEVDATEAGCEAAGLVVAATAEEEADGDEEPNEPYWTWPCS
jgi:hypothetical protein